MNANLVGIAGVPPQDMSGKLVGVGGCGCAGGFGETAPTDDQRSALNWASVGFFGIAIVLGYFMLREPGRHR